MNSSVSELKDAADRAMMRGDANSARDLLERLTKLSPGRVDLWLSLAGCNRALGESLAALAAVESALQVEPRCFPALLMKGALLEAMGEPRKAAKIYGTARLLAPAAETLAEPMRRALVRAEQVHDTYANEMVSILKSSIGLTNGAVSRPENRRMAAFIETIAGKRKTYSQKPVSFHYPGLPAIEFYERSHFPWIAELEAHTDEIRSEVVGIWRDRKSDLVPYINYPKGLPIDQWAELNRSLNWSALHLLENGERIERNCHRCPLTMEAIKVIDQPSVPGQSPAAMFSILKPRTRIPPHNGVANTRLVLHLPLIVPEGCGFRVGGETRRWREGEAWIFDDTIEHEAWNDSDKPRMILICDVWSPFLSREERSLITTVLAALDDFSGGTLGGASL